MSDEWDDEKQAALASLASRTHQTRLADKLMWELAVEKGLADLYRAGGRYAPARDSVLAALERSRMILVLLPDDAEDPTHAPVASSPVGGEQ